MNIFMGCRGLVYVLNTDAHAQAGFYRLNPPIQSSKESPVLLHYATVNGADIVMPQTTLNNVKLLYAFGQQFGQVSIVGSLLLGTPEVGNARALSNLFDWFAQNRSTARHTPLTLSMAGSVGVKVHIINLAIGELDQNFHVQQFALSGLMADLPQGKK